MKSNIITGLIIFILTLALIAAVKAWYSEKNKPPVSQIEYIKGPEIKEAKKINKSSLPGPPIIVTYEKEVAVEKLKLPDWIKTDINKQVIATAEIAPYDGITNTAAIMDTKTGVSEIIAKQVPLSLFAFENVKEAGVRVGYSTDETQATIYGRWNFLRVGSFHLGLYAEANSSGLGIGQVDLNYRW